jgi:hypothetical protein
MSELHFNSEKENITTRFVPTSRFSRWTFQDKNIKKWVESHLQGRVLNVCAGKTELKHNENIVRNDIDPEIKTDSSVDVAALPMEYEQNSFDTILYDPPWSVYQSNLRYDGRNVHKENDGWETNIDMDKHPAEIEGGKEKSQLGHSRLAKEGFDYLLKDGGIVVEITFHGTCMPSRMGFDREERVIFDPVGEGKAVIGSVDRKAQTTL